MLLDSIEQDLYNPQLKVIRVSYSRPVATRFVENYIRALTEYSVTQQQTEGESSYTVESTTTPKEVCAVVDWECQCNEMEKTGIACAHLIVVALANSDKPYTELISERWRIGEEEFQ